MNDTTPATHTVADPSTPNPLVLADQMAGIYERFVRTTYALAADELAAERARGLRGQLAAETLIEPMPSYQSSGLHAREAVAALGLGLGDDFDARAGAFLDRLMDGHQLYAHQWEAMRASVSGEDVVVTGGTGSGKTEAFWLPALMQLLIESERWAGQGAPAVPWWDPAHNGRFQPSRRAETGRLPGIRALVLYPMNALVEDQLVRLRRTLDSEEAHRWFAQHRNGHRFYFGRYTGQTPKDDLRGRYTDWARRAAVAQRRDEAEYRRLEAEGRLGDFRAHRPFLPRPLGSEQLVRQDMIQFAPDILVTNYSMLNVMLLRDDERRIFDQTRDLLDDDPAHRFYLIVDELHPYRGTAGTEVALLLRKLRHRVGANADQIRVIAASASLGADEQRIDAYLGQFFARPSFRQVNSIPVLPGDRALVEVTDGEAVALETLGEHVIDDEGVSVAVRRAVDTVDISDLADRLVNACRTDEDRILPTDAGVLAGRLFPGRDDACARRALTGALTALAWTRSQPVRAHYFVNVDTGWWACTDPTCDQVDAEHCYHDRPVGKLYAEPRIRCDCGARCLDLYACQTCGDVLLGGYAAQSPGGGTFLLPELPDLESAPDRAMPQRLQGSYQMYWPAADATRQPLVAQWTALDVTFGFQPVVLAPGVGLVRGPVPGEQRSGYLYSMTSRQAGRRAVIPRIPAIPTRCPNCNDRWEITHVPFGRQNALPLTSQRRMNSPIRSLRVSAERVSQVIGEAMIHRLYADSAEHRLIAFSDSRQDAARLAGGLDAAHYRDTVRQLVVRQLQHGASLVSRFQTLDTFLVDQQANAHLAADVRALRGELQLARDVIELRTNGALMEDHERQRIEAELAQALTGAVAVDDVARNAFDALVQMGRDPAGPHGPLLTGPGAEWWQAWEWPEGQPPRERRDQEAADYRREARAQVLTEMLGVIFSGAGRDIESLGFGYLAPRATVQVAPVPGADDALSREIVLGVIRKMGSQRFYPGARRGRRPTDTMPQALNRWLKAVCEQHTQLTEADVLRWAADNLPHPGQVLEGWNLNPGQLVVALVDDHGWRCQRCNWVHLHGDAGTCQHCLQPAAHPRTIAPADLRNSYFADLAAAEQEPSRLTVQELTAQTGRDVSQRRQAYFQDVFLDDEPELACGIDVLSVTTTMEAGVDIGSLRAVLLANMPPQRQNYQQRVGRAGRRGDPLSVALTVCRDRSHDGYYFAHPEEMTASAPSEPYLTTDRDAIFRRVVRAEALRLAFDRLADQDPVFAQGRNIHGQFGLADEFDAAREAHITQYLADRTADIEACTAALLEHTLLGDQIDAPTLTAQVLGDLVAEVREIADLPDEHPDLSQRLAERGLLPLYGFPTQVRYLYLNRPGNSESWPPEGALDRDMRLGISEYAPGNEIVAEKLVHTSVGLVGFRPTGFRPEPLPPLGAESDMGICDDCQGIDPDASGTCPDCGSTNQRAERLSRPAGFRTSWSARDREPYEGSVERLSRSSSPKLATPAQWDQAHNTAGLRVEGGHTPIWQINDRGGAGFNLAPANRHGGGVVDPDLAPNYAGGPAGQYILGARYATDVLVARPGHPRGPAFSHICYSGAGGRPGLITTARRAAWSSLAFALRVQASVTLNVEPREFEGGMRLIAAGGGVHVPQIFLADSIENGAGFTTWLRDPVRFQQLVDDTLSLIASDWENPDVHDCGASCPGCLRDWSNTPYHPLLDWRLAADTLEILVHGQVRRDRWDVVRGQAVDKVAGDFGWTVIERGARPVLDTGSGLICVVHPLDPVDGQLDQGVATQHGPALPFDCFNFDRRPGEVFRRL